MRTVRPLGARPHGTLTPEELGLRRASYEDIASGRDVERDAVALLRVILGKDSGPRSDIVCLNAAPMLYTAGTVGTIGDGIAMARNAITSGAAIEKLRAWVSWQNERPEDGLSVLDRMIAKAS